MCACVNLTPITQTAFILVTKNFLWLQLQKYSRVDFTGGIEQLWVLEFIACFLKSFHFSGSWASCGSPLTFWEICNDPSQALCGSRMKISFHLFITTMVFLWLCQKHLVKTISSLWLKHTLLAVREGPIDGNFYLVVLVLWSRKPAKTFF